MAQNLKLIEEKFRITGFYTAFSFSWDAGFEFKGESHRVWEIVYVSFGEVEVSEDEKIYHLVQDNMVLHAPMEFHRIKSYNGTTPRVLVVSFYAEGDLPEKLKDGVFLLSEKEREEYKRIFEKIDRYVKQVPESEYEGMEAGAMLSAFLIRLSEETSDNVPDRSETALLYKKIISSMQESVCRNLRLEDFSKQNGVSISYLKILFKKYAGISPKAYYTQLRIQQAIRFLEQGMAIAEISERMSFSSPNYFSEFIKKNTGRTPLEFRKNQARK